MQYHIQISRLFFCHFCLCQFCVSSLFDEMCRLPHSLLSISEISEAEIQKWKMYCNTIWLQSTQSSSLFPIHYLNPCSMHTHTQSSENAIMWHHSADSENLLCIPVGIRGVWSSPLFICRAEGWLLLWKCQVHLVRLPQHSSTRCMVSQPISPVCLFEGGTVDNRGHWEVHTVDGHLTIAGMLGHACEPWALEELFSKWL